MHARPWAILAATAIALAVMAAGAWWKQSRPTGVHPGFTQGFVDLNRRMDDHATAVAYDPTLRILAVGRDSGRLELWDASQPDARISRQAHTYRIEHIAFGAADGIVLTSSVGSNVMGIDPEGVPKVWDARTGELLLSVPGEWMGGPLIAAPMPGHYLLSSYDELPIYDHGRPAVVGGPLPVDGGITSLGVDADAGRVAERSSKVDRLSR